MQSLRGCRRLRVRIETRSTADSAVTWLFLFAYIFHAKSINQSDAERCRKTRCEGRALRLTCVPKWRRDRAVRVPDHVFLWIVLGTRAVVERTGRNHPCQPSPAAAGLNMAGTALAAPSWPRGIEKNKNKLKESSHHGAVVSGSSATGLPPEYSTGLLVLSSTNITSLLYDTCDAHLPCPRHALGPQPRPCSHTSQESSMHGARAHREHSFEGCRLRPRVPAHLEHGHRVRGTSRPGHTARPPPPAIGNSEVRRQLQSRDHVPVTACCSKPGIRRRAADSRAGSGRKDRDQTCGTRWDA